MMIRDGQKTLFDKLFIGGNEIQFLYLNGRRIFGELGIWTIILYFFEEYLNRVIVEGGNVDLETGLITSEPDIPIFSKIIYVRTPADLPQVQEAFGMFYNDSLMTNNRIQYFNQIIDFISNQVHRDAHVYDGVHRDGNLITLNRFSLHTIFNHVIEFNNVRNDIELHYGLLQNAMLNGVNPQERIVVHNHIIDLININIDQVDIKSGLSENGIRTDNIVQIHNADLMLPSAFNRIIITHGKFVDKLRTTYIPAEIFHQVIDFTSLDNQHIISGIFNLNKGVMTHGKILEN